MRLIAGAWRSTPLPALYCEAGVLPPYEQRLRISRIQYGKLCSSPPDHPIHKVFHQYRYITSVVFQHKQYRAPLLYRNTRIVEELNLQDTILTPNPPNSIIPPWYPLSAVVHTTPLEHALSTGGGQNHEIFLALVDKHFDGYQQIFTDGSLIKSQQTVLVGSAMYVLPSKERYRWKLGTEHSILAAELYAILKGVNYAMKSLSQTVIFTDNRSALCLIADQKPKSYKQIVYAIHNNILLAPQGKIKFHWVPAHTGILGNEQADKDAKTAAVSDTQPVDLPMDLKEFKSEITTKSWTHWQQKWNSLRPKYHLGTVKKSVSRDSLYNTSRKYETIFSQLRLGLTSLNKYLFRIGREDSPECEICQQDETVEHYLLKCRRFTSERTTMLNSLPPNSNPVSLSTLLLGEAVTTRSVEEYIRVTKRFD